MNKNAKKLTMLLAIGKPSKGAKNNSLPQSPMQSTPTKQTATKKKKTKKGKKAVSSPMMMKGKC